MSLESLNALSALDAMSPANVGSLLKELQGLTVSVVDGAAANTKMNIAAMRTEDTILAAVVLADTWAAPTDDTANVTIQATKASATFTTSGGGPANNETFVLNGVTYTFKTTPTAGTHVKIGVSNSVTLDNLVATVNAYETRRTGGGYNTAACVAVKTSASVVTITAADDGVGNGAVVTENTTGSTIVVVSTVPEAVTATFASAVNANALVVNGVTFTIKTSPTAGSLVEIGVKASDTLQAAAIANALNAYENVYGTLDVLATAALGVVTIAPRSSKKGNIISISDSAANFATSGSGYLANGTATGGIKSTTNLSTATLLVVWFNKR